MQFLPVVQPEWQRIAGVVVVAADAVAVAVADAVAAVAVTVPPQAARFYYCPLPRFSEGQHCQYDVHDHDLR